jgi:hypothetical protein
VDDDVDGALRLRPDGLYAEAVAAHPEVADVVLDTATAGLAGLPGSVLTDAEWLAGRVADARRRWDCADDRVAATLWWYSSSTVLLAPAAAALAAAGRGVDLEPAGMRIALRADGFLRATRSGRALEDGPAALGRSLVALDAHVTALAAAGGAGPRSLWAIAADALANRLLASAGAAAAPALAAAAAAATGGLMPPPRFVTVPCAAITAVRDDLVRLGLPVPSGSPEDRRYVRRGSCCLLYLAPDGDMCVSCPRQPPATRLQRLAISAASG